MILVIDNYDSFTYNLVQCIGDLGYSSLVSRNDNISCQDVKNMNPNKIIISPGPGKPDNSGACSEIIAQFAPTIPILGVCLGHQTLGYVFGGKIIKSTQLMHGKLSNISHNYESIFKDIPNPFIAARYHSLVVEYKTFPKDLKILAWTRDNTVMACQHKRYENVIGIQFHPESLWTHNGKQIISNFLNLDSH